MVSFFYYLCTDMKKEPCLRLDEIASALSQADAARMAPELSPADRVIMEQACVTLREAERTAIVNVENDTKGVCPLLYYFTQL